MSARSFRQSLFAFSLLLAPVGSAQGDALLERISFSDRSDGRGIAVRFHAEVAFTAYRDPVVTQENEVEIIIFNAALDPQYVHAAPVRPIKSYRVTPLREHLRIRFTIEHGYPVRVAARRDRRTEELFLDLDFQADVAGPLPVLRERLPGEASVSASRSQSALQMEGAERWRLDTIVIDAGHGGRDAGAEAHGVREKDISLAVARKLGKAIADQLGLHVIYTRTDDRFIPLRERGRLANAGGGKLFISLHVNAAPSSLATGTETFFLGTHKTEAARHVMERENSVVRLENDPDVYRDMTDEALILQALTQSAYMQKSEELASLVEEAFEARSASKSRGVKQAGFYVLWGASMPSILVEMGFITNRKEAAFLASDYGQEFVVDAILRAIALYKQRYEREFRVVAP